MGRSMKDFSFWLNGSPEFDLIDAQDVCWLLWSSVFGARCFGLMLSTWMTLVYAGCTVPNLESQECIASQLDLQKNDLMFGLWAEDLYYSTHGFMLIFIPNSNTSQLILGISLQICMHMYPVSPSIPQYLRTSHSFQQHSTSKWRFFTMSWSCPKCNPKETTDEHVKPVHPASHLASSPRRMHPPSSLGISEILSGQIVRGFISTDVPR